MNALLRSFGVSDSQPPKHRMEGVSTFFTDQLPAIKHTSTYNNARSSTSSHAAKSAALPAGTFHVEFSRQQRQAPPVVYPGPMQRV
jgi:hypothetical protein